MTSCFSYQAFVSNPAPRQPERFTLSACDSVCVSLSLRFTFSASHSLCVSLSLQCLSLSRAHPWTCCPFGFSFERYSLVRESQRPPFFLPSSQYCYGYFISLLARPHLSHILSICLLLAFLSCPQVIVWTTLTPPQPNGRKDDGTWRSRHHKGNNIEGY